MASTENNNLHTFTCILIGDTAKTKLIFEKQLSEGGFIKTEMTAQGIEVRPLVFHTTRCSIQFNIMDLTKKNNYEKLRAKRDLRVEADCAIVMFDSAQKDHRAWLKKYMDVPTVLCGAKGQVKDVRKKTKLQYFYNINSTNKNNYEYMFLWLGGQLLGDMNLELLSMIANAKPPMEGECKQI